MCTPQSFPPTPVSRANVLARSSKFSDDLLFLARDQLRLGENLKPGVDETVRERAVRSCKRRIGRDCGVLVPLCPGMYQTVYRIILLPKWYLHSRTEW